MNRVTLRSGSKSWTALVPVLHTVIFWNSCAFLRSGETMTYEQVKHFTLPFHEAKIQS